MMIHNGILFCQSIFYVDNTVFYVDNTVSDYYTNAVAIFNGRATENAMENPDNEMTNR